MQGAWTKCFDQIVLQNCVQFVLTHARWRVAKDLIGPDEQTYSRSGIFFLSPSYLRYDNLPMSKLGIL
jgi:hypothetical protein